MIALLKLSSILLFLSMPIFAQTCTYSTWEWDTRLKKSVNHRVVRKDMKELTRAEIDTLTACTVCQEDQVWLEIPDWPRFKMCFLVAPKVKETLLKLKQNGLQFQEIIGYRVGRSRGPLDSLGRRTQFSNHSFGTAVDFDPKHNGLYGNCLEFGPHCKLRRGGKWDPQNKRSLRIDHPLVLAMKAIGFLWGGQIKGWQKDFMHFSLTGY